MRQQTIEMTGRGSSDWICIDRRGHAGTDLLVVLDLEDGNATATLEFTPDDCIEGTPSLVIEHDVLKDLTESCASTMTVPFQAFRLTISRYVSGTIKARVVQQGNHDY
jgi:hypothetical protein